ncbi:hypothetical protein BDV39DRAFT_38737 [Aspergillus sergii]|uniref:Uncharacterized protein n=1 Tax=Aspergillus sergii TaxID=1034303 RepID=A0A5N6WLY6_9EURO|nr:hypothetical protein BDV39DRAFT_38737 [Aspergillus sergii]
MRGQALTKAEEGRETTLVGVGEIYFEQVSRPEPGLHSRVLEHHPPEARTLIQHACSSIDFIFCFILNLHIAICRCRMIEPGMRPTAMFCVARRLGSERGTRRSRPPSSRLIIGYMMTVEYLASSTLIGFSLAPSINSLTIVFG